MPELLIILSILLLIEDEQNIMREWKMQPTFEQPKLSKSLSIWTPKEESKVEH